MNTKTSYRQLNPKRDYDKEIQEVFSEALKKINPEILQAIELVQKMNINSNDRIEIIVSSTGTNI